MEDRTSKNLAAKLTNRQQNKALHPTACRFGFGLRSFLTPLQAFASGGG